MTLRHGRAVRRGALETIVQRRRFDDRAERLRAEQVRLHAIEHDQALLNERQRLLRDMHDGLGASLISALILIEQGRLSRDDAARVLRECLDDLRLVIDSLEPIEHDLATLRSRLGDRLALAGIAIDFDATTAGAAGGHGLKHLQHRASQIGAEIHIDAAPGQGTRLCVRMPSAPAGAAAPNKW